MFTTLPSERSRLQRLVAYTLIALQAVSPMLYSAHASAQSAPTTINADRSVPGQRPVVNVSANGVPVVQISPPTAGGVSNNRFTDYNVGDKGLVLNNTGANNQTQLAGWIAGNPMLGNSSAKTILNQVTGSTPTSLAGYTEVAGNQANVVVANPNGITCTGCGFINAPRITLSTGTPELSADGALLGFQVRQGQINIEGAGLSARNVDQVDLISRTLKVNAEIWANKLEVSTGSARVDYETGAVTPQAAPDAAPLVSLDVSQLGGMYANSIRMIGTEQGMGVNSEGTITALTGTLELTQAGDVRIAGNVQAKQDILIKSGANVANAGAVFAEGKTAIDAQGNMENSGILMAGGSVDVIAGSVKNAGSMASGAGADGKIKAQEDLNIAASGDVQNNGQMLAGRDLALSAANAAMDHGNLTAVRQASISAAGNFDNRNSRVQASNITIDAAGWFSNADGVVESQDQLTVIAPRIDNTRGTMKQTAEPDAANKAVQGIFLGNRKAEGATAAEKAQDILINEQGLIASNASTMIQVQAVVNAGGTVQSAGALVINGSSGIDNRKGKLTAGGALSVTTEGVLNNTGGNVTGDQQVSISAGGEIVNRDDGNIHGGAVRLAASAIDNSGGRIVQSGTASQSIELAGNFRNTDGVFASNAENITLKAAEIDNAGGQILHGGSGELALAGSAGVNNVQGLVSSNGNVAIDAGNGKVTNAAGTISSAGNARLSGSAMDNTQGVVAADGNLTLQTAGTVDNRGGKLQADGALSLTAASLDNGQAVTGVSGRIIATGTKALSINLAGDLNNVDGTIASNSAVNLKVGNIANSKGTIYAAGNLSADVAGNFDNRAGVVQADGVVKAAVAGALDNRNGLVQGGGLDLRAGTLANTNGLVYLAGAGQATITVLGALDNSKGSILSEGSSLRLNAGSVNNNAGTVSAKSGFLEIQATGALDNTVGQLLSEGGLTVKAGSLSNAQGGRIQSTAAMQLLSGSDITNAGSVILSGGTLTALAAGNIDNAGGIIEAAKDTTLTAHNVSNAGGIINLLGDGKSVISAGSSVDNTGGSIGANGSVAILAKDTFVNTGGTVTTGKDLEIDTDKFSLQSGKLNVSGTLALTMKDVLDNRGNTFEAQGGLIIRAAAVDNSAGGELIVRGEGILKLETAGDIKNNGGFIGSRGDVALAGSAIDNSGQGIVYASKDLSITAAGDITNHTGTLEAGATLTSLVGGLFDNTDGTVQVGTMNLQAGSLDNRAGELLQLGGGGNVINVTGEFNNVTGLLSSNGGTLDIATGMLDNRNGIINHAGTSKLAIAATGAIDNGGGELRTMGVLAIDAQSVSNISAGRIQSEKGAVIAVSDTLNNTGGAIMSAATLQVIAKGNVDNRDGTIQAAKALVLGGDTIDNRKGSIVSLDNGGLSVSGLTVLINEEGFIGGNGDVAVAVKDGGIANANGMVYAKQAVSVSAGQDVDNRQGMIQAGAAFSSDIGGTLDNRAGLVQADSVDLYAGGFDNRTGKLLQSGTAGSAVNVAGALNNAAGTIYSAGSTLHITAGAFDNNAGDISHTGTGSLVVSATGAVDNNGGRLLTEGDLTVIAGSLSNNVLNGKSGLVQGRSVAIGTTGNVSNANGSVVSSGALSVIALGEVDNRAGTLQAAGAIALGSERIDNSKGSVVSLDSSGVTVFAIKGLVNEEGFIGGNGNVGIAVQDGGIANAKGAIYAKNALTLSATGQVDNVQGVLQAGTAFSGNIGGVLANQGGLIQANHMDLQTGGLDNHAGRILQLDADATSNIHVVGALSNGGGKLVSNNAVLNISAGSIDNAQGEIAHNGNQKLTLEAQQNLSNDGGKLLTAGVLAINAESVGNNVLNGTGGQIQAGKNISIAVTASLGNAGGTILGSAALDVQTGGTIDNTGGAIQAAKALSLQGANIDNTAGRVTSLDQGGITAGAIGTFKNDGGIFDGNGNIQLSVGTLSNDGGKITAQANLDVTAGALTSTGDIYAGAALTAKVAGALNNASGSIQAMQAVIDAGSFDNSSGKLLATGTAPMAVNIAGDLVNNGGFIGGNGDVALSATQLVNAGGTIYAKKGLGITTATLANTGGTIQAEAMLAVKASSSLANQQGLMQAAAFDIQSPNLDNSSGKILQLGSSDTTLVFAGVLNNAKGVIATNGANLVLGASAIDNSEGKITHAGSGVLTVTSVGAVNNNGGELRTAGDITIDAQSLSNKSFSGKAGVVEGGKSVTVSVVAGLDNAGGSIGSGTAMSINAQGNADNTGGTLQAGKALALQAANIDNTNGIITSLDGSGMSLDTPGTLTNHSGSIAANGAVALAASTLTNDGGIVYAKGALAVIAGKLDNSGGTLQSETVLTATASGELVNKQGTIQAQQFVIQAPNLDNTGGKILQLGNGDTSLVFSGALNNANGTIATNGANLKLAAASIDNSGGEITHAGNGTLEINSAGAVGNSAGKLRTAGAFTLAAQTLNSTGGQILSGRSAAITTAGDIVNAGGGIVSGSVLTLQTQANLNNHDGMLQAGSALTITASSIDNTKGNALSLDSTGLAVRATGAVINEEGMIGGNGAASVQAATFSNKLGKLTATAGMDITANGVDNKGGAIKAGDLLAMQVAGALDSAGGNIQAGQLTIAAGSLDNSAGKLQSTGTAAFSLNIGGNAVNTGGFIGGNGDVALSATDVDNTGGAIYTKGGLDIGTGKLVNTAGTLQADGKLAVTVAEELVNKQGLMQAEQLALQAPSLDNSAGKILQTGTTDTALIFTGAIANAKGTIATNGGNLTLSASTIDNSEGDITHAGAGKLVVNTSGDLNNNTGKMRTAGELAVNAQTITSVSGLIESKKDAALVSGSGIDLQGGSVISGAALVIQAQTSINNTSGTIEAAKALALQAADLDNTKGHAVSLDASGVSVNTSNTLVNREGTIGSNGTVTLAAASLDNTLGRVTGIGNVSITAPLIVNKGGIIKSQQELTVDTGANGYLDNTQQAVLQGNKLNLLAPNLSNAGGSIIQTGSSDTVLQINGTLDNTGGAIASNGNNMTINAQGISNNGGQIKHGGANTLTLALPGAIGNAGGTISSNGNAVVSAATITNTSGGVIEAQGSLTASAGTSLNNNGGVLQSNGALTVTTPDMSNVGGALYSDSKLTLNVPGFNNTGGTLSADEIAFQAMSSVKNAGGKIIQTGSHDLNFNVSQDIDNTGGTIAANGNISLSGTTLKNSSGTVRAAGVGSLTVNTGALDNAGGTLASGGAQTVNASSLNNQAGKITSGQQLALTVTGGINNNQGTIASTGNNSVSTGSLSNQGGTVASVAGKLTITTPSSINNTSGRIESGKDLLLNIPGLTNTYGSITADNLQINTQGYTLDNAGGKIAARQSLGISSGQLNNSAGLLQANGTLSVNTNGQALINTQSGSTNGIVGNGGVSLTTGSLNNQGGYIGSKGTVSIAASSVDNSQGGAIVSESAVSIGAGSLNNAGGQIQGQGNVDISLGGGSFNNSNGLVLAGGSLTVNAGQVNNSNTAAGKGLQGGNVTVNAASINNASGTIRADNQLVLGGSSLDNSYGTVSSANILTNNTSSINNTQGTLIAAQKLVMNSGAINGVGQYLSTGDLDFNYAGDYYNSSRIVASGNLKIASGGTITNSGQIGANNVLNLSAVNLNNLSSGEINAGTTNITVSNALQNQGVIDGSIVNINAGGGVVNNTNKIYGGTLGINAGTITNNASATIGARNAMTLTGGTITNWLDANILSLGGMTLNASSKLANRSGRIESFGNMAINAGSVDNLNDYITTTTVTTGNEHIVEYRLPGATTSLTPGTFGFNDVDNGRLVLDSASYPIWKYGTMPYERAVIDSCNGDSGCYTTYPHDASSPVWTLFGVTPPGPKPVDPGSSWGTGGGVCDAEAYGTAECYAYQVVLQQWNNEVAGRSAVLDQKIYAFNNDLFGRMNEDYYIIDATRTTTATTSSPNSKPGQIFVGGNLALNGPGGSVLNDRSQIVVQGSVTGSAANITQIADQNIKQVSDVGTWQFTEIVSSGWSGHKRNWYAPTPYSDQGTPESLGGQTVWYFAQNTAPAFKGSVGAKASIAVGQSASGASDPNGSVGNLQNGNGTASVNAFGSAGGTSANPNGAGVAGTSVSAYNGQSGGNVPSAFAAAANAVDANGNATVSGSGQGGAGNVAAGTGSPVVSGAAPANVNGAAAAASNAVNGTAVAGVNGTAQNQAIQAATGASNSSLSGNAQGASPSSVSGVAANDVAASAQATAIGNAAASAGNNVTPGTSTQNSVSQSAQSMALPGAQRNTVAPGVADPNGLVTVQAAGNGNLSVRSVPPSLAIPASNLFKMRTEPGLGYLIETDPRFTNYRNWLSSDFMLQQLGNDPAKVLKRLGDGFYEQRLVADQIMYATGNRFVGDYTSNEEQYAALMQAGVAFGQQYHLTVGVALSQEQMQQLTGDMVWLVQKDVTLADGSMQSVLVPQAYVRVKEGDIQGDGTLISARDIALNLTGDLANSGLIASRNLLDISAENIHNLSGGRLQGGTVDLTARTDLNNLSGTIAGNTVTLDAGRDITIRSVTIDTQGLNTTRTGVGAIANVTGDDITIAAGRDLTVAGAKIVASNDALLTAGGDLSIGTVQTRRTLDIAVSGYVKDTELNHLGSAVAAGNNLTLASGLEQNGDVTITGSTLSAGNNLFAAGTNITVASAVDSLDVDMLTKLKNATASTVAHEESAVISKVTAGKDIVISATGRLGQDGQAQAGSGDLTLQAAALDSTTGQITLVANNDVKLIEQQLVSTRQDENHYKGGTLLSKKTSDSTGELTRTQSVGTTVSGDSIVIGAGDDLLARAAQVVGTSDVTLLAKNNVTITSAQETTEQARTYAEKTSGLFSNGGASITLGKQQLEQDGSGQSVTHTGSQIASLTGNVVLGAGQTYTQTASQVLALQGDIDIAAKKVEINAATDSSASSQHDKSKSSGLTLAVSSPVISAVQTVGNMAEAAGNTSDPRMKVLAAATAALAVKNAYDAVQDPSAAASLQISLTVGSSKSESRQTAGSTTAVGSLVAAGNNVNISAAGAGKDSGIDVIGSDIKAGNDASLQADGQINLQAAQNTAEQHSNNSSSGASVGVAFSVGAKTGFSLIASASQAGGKADGSDVTYSNSHIDAGNTVSVVSGGDTTLKGAVIGGKQVIADIGGNLNVESLQDTSTYDSKQHSVGGSISVGISTMPVTGSLSVGKSNIDSSYASVTEQSGIKAGEGGYDIQVKGKTDLIGGVIASSQSAIDSGKTSFTSEQGVTQTDIVNSASYSANSAAISVSTEATKTQGIGAGIGQDSGNAATVTKAGIGVSTEQDTTAAIKPIFDAQKVQAEVNAQVAITQAFTLEAPKAVASFAGTKAQDLKDQAAQAQLAGDENAAKELLSEAAKWGDGGIYRVALHTASGALAGGLNGALGAAASAESADLMNKLQDSTQDALQKAGLSAEAAKAVAQGVTALTATVVGAAVGGVQGAATALTVDANNRQLHPEEKALAAQLAAKSSGKYTQAQIEEALRASGNSALGEDVTTGVVVPLTKDTPANTIYDTTGMRLTNYGNGQSYLVQAVASQVDSALAAYIKSNTGDTYSWSNGTLGIGSPSVTKPANPFAPGWNTGNYSAGLSPDMTPEQRQANLVGITDKVSTGTGLAAIWAPPPVDLALLGISGAFKASNYLLSPPTPANVLYDSATTVLPAFLPQTQWMQTGFSVGTTLVQPFITPLLENNLQQSSSCNSPRKC
jgi:filamentous hemagglutinin